MTVLGFVQGPSMQIKSCFGIRNKKSGDLYTFKHISEDAANCEDNEHILAKQKLVVNTDQSNPT